MRKTMLAVSVAVAALFAFNAAAQNAEVQRAAAPGKVGVSKTYTVTAKIKAVNPATREVTVTGPDGQDVTMTAGPEVKNFNQLAPGQDVDVVYAEALMVELHKGGGKPVVRSEQTGTSSAPAGERPGAVAGRQVTVVGDVIDLDPATQRVTVRGPNRTVNMNVRDPDQFKLISKGDQLEATYVEAVAVEVRPAPPKR